jgi:ABC-type multidrug transport system ATPase subunit
VKHPTLLILDEPLQGLDPLNRQLVRRFVDVLISEGATQLLFVSHHAEDAPDCITHRLEFAQWRRLHLSGRSTHGLSQNRGPCPCFFREITRKTINMLFLNTKVKISHCVF